MSQPKHLLLRRKNQKLMFHQLKRSKLKIKRMLLLKSLLKMMPPNLNQKHQRNLRIRKRSQPPLNHQKKSKKLKPQPPPRRLSQKMLQKWRRRKQKTKRSQKLMPRRKIQNLKPQPRLLTLSDIIFLVQLIMLIFIKFK